jgi:TonB family protein
MTSLLSRRSMFAGSASLTFHAALLALALVLVGVRAANPPPPDLAPIEILAPALGPIGTGPTLGQAAGSGQTTLTGAPSKPGHAPPKRSFTHAPPVHDPYADVVIGYDTPSAADPGSTAPSTGLGFGTATIGAGLGAGTGFGDGGDGPGIGTGVPEPPRSHARPPRPKQEYLAWGLPAVRQFVGKTVTVELYIDPAGSVRKVVVLQGVAPSLDQQASDIARSFEFAPALKADGVPRWGTFRWDFKIIDNRPRRRPLSTGSIDWREDARGIESPLLQKVTRPSEDDRP